MRNQTLHIL